MPRVFAALLLPHDVCDALARDAKAFARIDPLARFTRSTNPASRQKITQSPETK